MIKIKTTSSIVEGSEPVLTIFYDSNDGLLSMVGQEPLNDENTVTVSLSDIVARDPSLEGIETLPEDWQATRKDDQDAWNIGPLN